ncbi:hypothetical protein DXG01_016937 [Tephrocybe rancida]|nr:hypothetical protein DXG01_016937 [Tephrocybe rancida]
MAPTMKFKSALRSAASLPSRIRPPSSPSFRTPSSPTSPPLALLRVQILGCSSLTARDRNGASDPFVVVSLMGERHTTPVAKRTLEPVYLSKEATWDFPVFWGVEDSGSGTKKGKGKKGRAGVGGVGALEIVVWDKDMVGKDYLGEAALPLSEWFGPRAMGWEDEGNVPFTIPLESTRAGTPVSGSVHLKIGFVRPSSASSALPASPSPASTLSFEGIYAELLRRSSLSLSFVPPTEGVGTTPSTSILEDDGGLSSDEASSSDEDSDSDAEGDEPEIYTDAPEEFISTTSPPKLDTTTPPMLTLQPSSPLSPADEGKTPTASIGSALAPAPLSPVAPSPTTPTTPSSKGFAKIFPIPIRRLSGLGSSSSSNSSSLSSSPRLPSPGPTVDPVTGAVVPGTPAPAAEEGAEGKKDKEKNRLFRKSWGASAPTTPSSEVGDPMDVVTPKVGKGRKGGLGKVRKGKEGRAFSLDAGNDIVGIVMLEVVRAEDLPRLKNMTRTSFDMDPFIVLSFGKKVFRTRVVRHSLNPVFNEKLLFHVRRYERAWDVRVRVSDWDKMSANDAVGEGGFEVADLIKQAPQPNADGMYEKEEEGEHPMVEMRLKLEGEPGNEWAGGCSPVVVVRAKYQPYDLLRQRFWRQYLAQYDTDDTDTISHIELTSLLDSLGSTLTKDTVDAFWTDLGKEPHVDELSIAEAIASLEKEIGRPEGERRRVGDVAGLSTSTVTTPAIGGVDGVGEVKGDGGLGLDFSKMDFAGKEEGPQQPLGAVAVGSEGEGSGSAYSSDDAGDVSEGAGAGASAPQTPQTLIPPKAHAGLVAGSIPAKKKKSRFRRKPKIGALTPSSSSQSGSPLKEDVVERVINVKSCPLCHRPRMSDKAEMDIITHLAVCASSDWGRVDRIVVGNFVTASQAQRKWYTNIIGKVSGGDYRIGANSANIIVQNRMTGQLEEEKMQVYVRLGIRLLYKGATSRMEGGRARRLLKSLSIKQGVKYDAPQSAADIPAFIEFHGLNMGEILDPLESFSTFSLPTLQESRSNPNRPPETFNQFFYRKLKPEARQIESQNDPYRLVSAADCRLMTFATVDDATRLWIKGREFSVAKLLGEAYRGEAERYRGGAVAIFRLAPQDYHRFHSPVEGTVGAMSLVAGEYYTVNPQAIRSSLDVYGENVRKIVPIDSPQFGRVMAVCIGAMMVGSIQTTVAEGEHVHRGQEFGFFAFGGSTIVVLFEKDSVEWDEDLLINGRASLETLVRVGTGIGTGQRPVATAI